MAFRLPGLRWTKLALLTFGAGLVLGFVVVVLDGHPRLERVAGALMALSLLGLPLCLFADSRGVALVAWMLAHLRRRRGGRRPARGRKSGRPPPQQPRRGRRAPVRPKPAAAAASAKPRARPRPRPRRTRG